MSILLDALKKSEQQRQLGQTPTLETGVSDRSAGRETLNHWLPMSMMALSAIVMAWYGWQQYRVPDQVTLPAVTAQVAQDAGEQQPRTMTESFQSDTGERQEPAVASAATVAADADAKTKLNQSFNNFTAQTGQEAAVEPPGTVAATVPEPEPAAAKPGTRPSSQPATRPRKRQGANNRANDNSNNQRARQSRLEPHIAEPISFWELPQGIRDELEVLKITVLVYAEKPGDRFLLTNGKRMAEMDKLENGLMLEEIRRDGAVFRYRNYRFLVKG